MNAESIKVQMKKSVLEYCVLSIIGRGDAYISDLIEELKRGRLIAEEGTLYPVLTRLKNEEFLTYRREESDLGPSKKYYSLTTKGEIFLWELTQAWNELTKSVEMIINNRSSYKDE